MKKERDNPRRMFTLVMLAEDKRGHQYARPPIGPQDIEE